MTKQEKLFLACIKTEKYNSIAKEIEPYILNYWQALKEIWQTPITTSRSYDYEILEKNGLGKKNKCFGKLIDSWWGIYWSWDYDLHQLNNQLKIKF